MTTSVARLVPLEPPAAAAEASLASPLAPLVLAPPSKPTWPTLAALAVATGLAAVGLGAWALLADARSTDAPQASAGVDRSIAVLADSTAVRYPLRNAAGRISLVVARGGSAALTLDGLGPAPAGSVYEAWVVPPGSATPLPAGAFEGSERVVALTRPVAREALVAVTLEPSPGADRPSRTLRLTAVRG